MSPRANACNAGTILTERLIAQALGLGASIKATATDLMLSPSCYLEAQHHGRHYAFVMELNPGGVWVTWSTATQPMLRTLADCPAETADRMDGCGGFRGHRGAHGWQIHGPRDRASQEALEGHLRAV